MSVVSKKGGNMGINKELEKERVIKRPELETMDFFVKGVASPFPVK